MMRRSSLLLVSLVAVAALAGCNYDPETRLFRQVAPKPEDVSLAAPGADTRGAEGGNTVEQALDVCDDETLRCHAQNIASMLNQLTSGMLTIVDGVVRQPPTHRETGRRVWGPHLDRNNGNTFRFEMVRDDDDTFRWCVHVGAGDLRAAGGMREMTCDTETADNGMLRLLSGNLSPGEVLGEAARSGRGTMLLEALRLAEIEDSPDLVGTFNFDYDNTAGQDVHIVIEDLPTDRRTRFGDAADYRYTRDPDGHGTFSFQALADFVGDGGFGSTPDPEHFEITAQWQPDNAGRADATISGGDLDEGVSYTATHCWDDELVTTYAGNTFAPDEAEGDIAGCVFDEPLPRDDA